MPKEKSLTTREAAILAVLESGERYGLDIRDELIQTMHQTMPLGSLYVTLERMQEGGLLQSRIDDTARDTRGNRRRYFRLSGKGSKSLSLYRAAMRPMMRGLHNA